MSTIRYQPREIRKARLRQNGKSHAKPQGMPCVVLSARCPVAENQRQGRDGVREPGMSIRRRRSSARHCDERYNGGMRESMQSAVGRFKRKTQRAQGANASRAASQRARIVPGCARQRGSVPVQCRWGGKGVSAALVQQRATAGQMPRTVTASWLRGASPRPVHVSHARTTAMGQMWWYEVLSPEVHSEAGRRGVLSARYSPPYSMKNGMNRAQACWRREAPRRMVVVGWGKVGRAEFIRLPGGGGDWKVRPLLASCRGWWGGKPRSAQRTRDMTASELPAGVAETVRFRTSVTPSMSRPVYAPDEQAKRQKQRCGVVARCRTAYVPSV